MPAVPLYVPGRQGEHALRLASQSRPASQLLLFEMVLFEMVLLPELAQWAD